ncbi:beta-carotene hydroxylase [Sphingomonas japonica]|uniref:Beta-carotene 3-hydroxylase n=1 Tax=Sphingomonas japonica TaxID=511662 RepID=A0ABX0TZ42_9SPHN|nr:beta-carotene hydroxylase [Sphingomonas japonica]NIJ23095.1 beta-carotene 3-hydroxylase [Sphingomonas japonica]
MTAFEKIATVVAAIAFMEFFAWSVHKYVMHGWGWGWHRDHHEPHDHALERNDLYAVVFAGIVMTMFAASYAWPDAGWSYPLHWIAVGITLYGAIYAFIHDGLVHQRFFRWVPKRGYAKRLVQAHKLHHATIGKEGGVSFGFILAPDPQRLKAELKRQKTAGIAVVRPAAVD